MRVLILTQYYAPEPNFKVVDLARGLRDLGHDVSVLTSFPCYPQGRTYEGYRQSLFQEETIDGTPVTRVPQFPDHSKSVMRRTLYYLTFALSAATIGLLRTRRADVMLVYQSAMPIGLAAWVISRVKRMPYVLDVVDLWPESVASSGMLKNRWLMGVIRMFIKFIYRGATRINVITEGYRENLIAMGVPAEKISLIHCWTPTDQLDLVAKDRRLAQFEPLHGRFNVVYAGGMGPAQNLETVIEAATMLRDTPRVQFVLAGDGVDHARLVQLAEDRRADNVQFIGRRPPEEIQKLYELADALLVHLKPDAMSRVSIPSKTFSYMASGRPLIMAVEGESAALVEKHDCGVSAVPSDPEQLAAAVRRLFEMPSDERRRMGDAALAAYQDNYSVEVQIHKFANNLDRVARRKAA